jgi:hypothetical protein
MSAFVLLKMVTLANPPSPRMTISLGKIQVSGISPLSAGAPDDKISPWFRF